MQHRLLAALLFFCLPALLFSQELKIQFIGNAAFLITDGKTTLLSDYPYTSGSFGYMTYDFSKIKPTGETLCLITHGHADHFDLSLFEKSNCKIIAPADVTAKVNSARVIATPFQFSGITVNAIETPHAKVGHYSYVVTWHGKRLYFTGDTESTDALLKAQKLDIAFVTPWLLSTILQQHKLIDAAQILIYHHAAGEELPACQKCASLKQGETLTLKY